MIVEIENIERSIDIVKKDGVGNVIAGKSIVPNAVLSVSENGILNENVSVNAPRSQR